MVEVFQHPQDYQLEPYEDGTPREPGWYYWYLEPGCLPDTEPLGPFDSEEEALANAEAEADDHYP
jgi:hypothetical protein